jgi:RES domain-containing protein
VLDGEGARLNGGRWNPESMAVVYTSATLSLAALEYLVHVDIEDVPGDLVSIEIEVPDDEARDVVELGVLPEDWNTIDEHPECTAAGAKWVRRGETLILRVPSAVIPWESNFLLNPGHPGLARVNVVATRDFAFDPRLLA